MVRRQRVSTVHFATVGGDRPLRGVVVGAGFLSPYWARELIESPDTQLVGWVDLDAARARARADELGLHRLATGASLSAMLGAEVADFIVNATAPEAHHEVTMSALAHGTAVLSEKPLAATMEQAREMVASAERAERLFVVSQNRRYMPALLAYRDTVARLGTLATVSCDFYMAHRKDVGHYLHMLDQPLLLDMAIHLLDGARAITGADPVSVYCESYKPPWSWFAGATAAHAIFEMIGGLRLVLNSNWCADGFQTSWTGSWRTVGERGTAIWDGETAPRVDRGAGVKIAPRRAKPKVLTHDRFFGLEEALMEFVAALRTGKAPQGECHDNLLRPRNVPRGSGVCPDTRSSADYRIGWCGTSPSFTRRVPSALASSPPCRTGC
jgi:predicted dehydrogenase